MIKYVWVILGALLVALSVIAVVFPSQTQIVFGEDRLVETATAMVFLTAAVICGRAIFLRRAISLWQPAILFISLLAFLDEMSFGERQFGFIAPRLFGYKIDGLHDLLQVLYGGGTQGQGRAVLVAAALLIAAAAALYLAVLALQARLAKPRVQVKRHLAYVAVAAAFVAFAQFLDLNIWFPGKDFATQIALEEQLELFAGIILLAISIDLWRSFVPDIRKAGSGCAANR